jgi:hypothetical protein
MENIIAKTVIKIEQTAEESCQYGRSHDLAKTRLKALIIRENLEFPKKVPFLETKMANPIAIAGVRPNSRQQFATEASSPRALSNVRGPRRKLITNRETAAKAT